MDGVWVPYNVMKKSLKEINDSSLERTYIFEGVKDWGILASKNFTIAESLLAYPPQKSIRDFYDRKVDAIVSQAAINKFITVPKPKAS